jgi:peptidoglycan hydrolase-like amidase
MPPIGGRPSQEVAGPVNMTRRRAIRFLTTGALVAGALVVSGAAAPAGAIEINPVPVSGSWTVDGRGNGHGHGLSQYGARGAAIAGLTYDRILAFYYPGSALATAALPTIRVQISGAGSILTVASQAGLSASGVALPTNVDLWRAVPVSGGFQVQRHLPTGWGGYANVPGTRVDFRATSGRVAVLRSSGTSVYRGVVSAVNSGGVQVVNTLALDDYVRGVVPSEMPAAWQPAAVQAQAVAARTYADYYVSHPRAAAYDICDTTNCQVYGGASAEQAASNDAVGRTSNRILTYQGATLFAEFSASNGGLTSSGNQPYFVTKVDPYDNAASGDPYLSWTRTATAAQVAVYYGLRSVSQVQITGRSGGGTWGGLVTTATVVGVGSDGAPAVVTTTGAGLASAMGLPYSYFHIRPTAAKGHVDSVAMTGLHTFRATGWTYDAGNGAASSTVRMTVDGASQSFPANLVRADVQRAFALGIANHGFDATVTVPGGTHRICVYGVALNGVDTSLLSCNTVVVPVSPLGHVDTVTTDGAGHYRLTGWTFDPDQNGGPARVHVYVDAGGYSLPAATARPDVQSHFGLANGLVGFDVTVPVGTGSHRLCAYGINAAGTPGVNVTLQCWQITR